MAKRKDRIVPGDQIHIVVTKDFAPIANDFFRFCAEQGYNPSQIIRSAITNWLREKMKEKRPIDKLVEQYERAITKEAER
ncbi:MAG: hypothetical protein QXT63_01535 [Thermoplasmata archaeon]